jgi:hypothetical protein
MGGGPAAHGVASLTQSRREKNSFVCITFFFWFVICLFFLFFFEELNVQKKGGAVETYT